jgi:DNA repair exonuclease SbcCD ATPase subunit
MVPPAVRKEESKKLMHRAFDLEKKAEKLESPKMKELAQEMKQISEEMKKKELDQQQALAKLSSLEQKAKERREELSKEGPFDSKTLQKSMGTGDGGASNPEREALKKKLGELAEKVEQAKELAKAGDAASKEKLDRLMKEMGKDLKDSLGKDQKDEELQKALDELADGLDGESPEALEKLLENVDGELEDLAKLLEEFDALEDELAALKAMKGQFDGELERCMFCGKMSGD